MVFFVLVAPFVDLFVQVFETSPAVEVIPEIIEPFDFFFGSIDGAQKWYRLIFTEPSLTLEHGGESLEERVVIFVFQLVSCRNVFLERLIMRVNRVELPAAFWICENVHGFLDAFEKRVIVGLAGNSSLFVRVMF